MMRFLRTFFLTILTLFIMMISFSASGRVFVRQLITGIDEAEGALDPVPGGGSSMQAVNDAEADGKLRWIPIDAGNTEAETEAETETAAVSVSADLPGEDSADADRDDGAESGRDPEEDEGHEDDAAALDLIRRPVDESLYYYRTVLSDEELSLYNTLYECATAEPGSAQPQVTLHTDPSSDTFHTSFSRAYNALLFDHPELFWLTMSGGVFSYSYYRDIFSPDTYTLRFQLTQQFADRDERIREFENAAADLLSGIDLSQPQPQVAMQIHDALIDKVSYDKVLAGSDSVDLAHTAYGALVCNSRGEACTAVCDGYSYAYEYLLQKVGIQCIVVAGRAGDYPESAGSHSWNLVRLGDDWYEVDSTWNDITFAGADASEEDFGELAAEALISDEYMDLLHHFMFNLTTEEISHFDPGEDYRYTTFLGWVSFLSESVHIRHTAEEAEDTGDYMTQYAPVAYGKTYSYSALIR